MLLQPSKVLPAGDQWLYELKFDGYHGLAIKNHTSTRLYSRNGKDLTSRFLPIVHVVQSLPAKHLILDGEIVCLESQGRPCFKDLQNYTEGEHSLYFYAFDLLHLNGDSLVHLPLTERKEWLTKLLRGACGSLLPWTVNQTRWWNSAANTGYRESSRRRRIPFTGQVNDALHG